MIQTIKCKKCELVKPIEDFYKRKKDSERRRVYCKKCQKAKVRSYYHDDPVRARSLRKANRKKNPKSYLIVSARQRAKRLNIPCSITADDFEIPEICPCFGIPLIQNNSKSSANSATLDQIIPGKGYVKGNIQVISLKANTMKSNASFDELIMFTNWIRKITE